MGNRQSTSSEEDDPGPSTSRARKRKGKKKSAPKDSPATEKPPKKRAKRGTGKSEEAAENEQNGHSTNEEEAQGENKHKTKTSPAIRILRKRRAVKRTVYPKKKKKPIIMELDQNGNSPEEYSEEEDQPSDQENSTSRTGSRAESSSPERDRRRSRGRSRTRRRSDPKNGKKHSENGSPSDKNLEDEDHEEGTNVLLIIAKFDQAWIIPRHRLDECDFFARLFGKESEADLEIEDEKITAEGVEFVMGHLNDDGGEVVDYAEHVAGIVAFSYMISWTPGIVMAESFMVSLNNDLLLAYFLDLSLKYNLSTTREHVLKRLRLVFWKCIHDPDLFKQFTYGSLVTVLSMPDLLIAEREMCLYQLIRKWIEWDLTKQEPPLEWGPRVFVKYHQLLTCLRLHSLVGNFEDIVTLDNDGLIPRDVSDRVKADLFSVAVYNQERYFQADAIPSCSLSDMNSADDKKLEYEPVDLSNEAFMLSCTRMGERFDIFKAISSGHTTVAFDIPSWRITNGVSSGLTFDVHRNNGEILVQSQVFRMRTSPEKTKNAKHRKSDAAPIHYRVILLNEKEEEVYDSGRQTLETTSSEKATLRVPSPFSSHPSSIHLFALHGHPLQPSFIHIQPFLRRHPAWALDSFNDLSSQSGCSSGESSPLSGESPIETSSGEAEVLSTDEGNQSPPKVEFCSL